MLLFTSSGVSGVSVQIGSAQRECLAAAPSIIFSTGDLFEWCEPDMMGSAIVQWGAPSLDGNLLERKDLGCDLHTTGRLSRRCPNVSGSISGTNRGWVGIVLAVSHCQALSRSLRPEVISETEPCGTTMRNAHKLRRRVYSVLRLG